MLPQKNRVPLRCAIPPRAMLFCVRCSDARIAMPCGGVFLRCGPERSDAGRLFVKWERKFCLVLARRVRRIETLCRAGGGEQLQLIRRQLIRVGERAGADHLGQRVVRGGKRCISAARPRSFSMSNAMV